MQSSLDIPKDSPKNGVPETSTLPITIEKDNIHPHSSIAKDHLLLAPTLQPQKVEPSKTNRNPKVNPMLNYKEFFDELLQISFHYNPLVVDVKLFSIVLNKYA